MSGASAHGCGATNGSLNLAPAAPAPPQLPDDPLGIGKVPEDTPESVYEQFHRALAKAKAEARYSAETRVFDAMPLAWLKSGYAQRLAPK
jgi:hypothetical protein